MLLGSRHSRGQKEDTHTTWTLQLTPANFSKRVKEEGGGQDGWRGVRNRDMVTAVPGVQITSLPLTSPDSPSPSRSSNLIIPNGRKQNVCPLTCLECFPALFQWLQQQQESAHLKLTEWCLCTNTVTSCTAHPSTSAVCVQSHFSSTAVLKVSI